ncbi:MAG: hypothetical protein NXI00_23145, partial [Cytophagales bacterium]|nr:hypothetical protein [Cytophagales bacterium]
EDRQLVGFDLAGDEAGFATSLFTEAFDYVHKNSSLGITVHSGEAAGWESVEQAIDLARATRLGHGVRLAESPQLVKRLELNVDHPTTIEVCVTSNLLTKTINCLEEHPVRQFYDAGPGLRIVPCTDGIAMIGTTVSEQYDILQCSFGFTPQELVSILEDSFKAAFCPPTVKESLLKAATSKYQTLLSSHGFVQ